MTGKQWAVKRIEMSEVLAKLMEDEVRKAWDSENADDIAKYLANAETCERLIGNLCEWHGDGADNVGESAEDEVQDV